MIRFFTAIIFTLIGNLNLAGQTAEQLLNYSRGDVFRGKYDSAIVKINKAIAMEPGLARGYYDRAFFYMALKNTYDQVNNEMTHLKGKQSYLTTEKLLLEIGLDSIYRKIFNDCSTAIRIDQGYWEAYGTRAEASEGLGLKQEALNDYKKELDLAPNLKRDIEPRIQRLENENRYKKEFETLCGLSNAKNESIKTGKFKYKEIPADQAYIERTVDSQTEHVPEQNIKITLSVKWVSDCEYHLTYRADSPEGFKGNIGKVIKAKIVEVTGDSYRVISEFEGTYQSAIYEKIK